MPGRQSHGRSLLGNSKPSGGKGKQQKSKSKARAHALDAFAIAAKQVEPERLTRRGRDLELDPETTQSRGSKHRRDEEDEDDSHEDEDEGPRKKRARQSAFDDEDEDEHYDRGDGEGGSDSDGNQWHVGVNVDDDDSELDSDEAFGDSDDEKFEGYAFRGSRSQKEKDGSDGEGGDDGASLGSDAIDLAAALDQSSDDDEEGSAGDTESGSEEEDSGPEGDEDGGDDDDDDEVDPSKLGELQNLINGFAGTEDAEADDGPSSKQTISLEDLGLSGVKDPLIKKSLKLMKKEEKVEATKKGTSKKLDVPLPRRRQDQLLRAAAYEKTNETLDRWNETVKHNRRADHLMFPLAHTLPDAGLDNGQLQPLTKKTAGTELEQTIMSIMEESGLGPSAKSKDEPKKHIDANGEEKTISRAELKELWAQRRKERELQSREQARSKRIKKIKSKTYRRVHRKERLGDEADALEDMRANGEIDSEEEREAAHRRRALERVGAKHKESKWAKMGSKVGRAVWDDDYRAGLADMARRNEELRKRVEGKTAGGDDDEDDSEAASSSGDEDRTARLLKELDGVDGADDDDDQPHAKLMKMAFMQRAEAQQKQANDELVAQLRRTLELGDEEEEEDDTEVQVGRRTFGMSQDKKASKPTRESSGPSGGAISHGAKDKSLSKTPTTDVLPAAVDTSSAPGIAGAWQSASSGRKRGKKSASRAEVAELDLDAAMQTASKSASAAKSSKAKSSSKSVTTAQADDGDSSDDGIHLPLAVRDLELVNRAFGGEDVVAEFEAEKEAIASEDDEKMIDATMPGWGSWAGEGISKRAQKRNKGKVMTKKEGVKKKDRKDAKLDKVIMNEKRIRKVRSELFSPMFFSFDGVNSIADFLLLFSNRTRNTSHPSCRIPLSPDSSMSGLCACLLDPNGRPRNLSSRRRSRGSSSSRALLRLWPSQLYRKFQRPSRFSVSVPAAWSALNRPNSKITYQVQHRTLPDLSRIAHPQGTSLIYWRESKLTGHGWHRCRNMWRKLIIPPPGLFA